jgi:hypothetical protein
LVRDNGTPGVSGSPTGGISVTNVGETGKMTIANLSVVNNKIRTSSTAIPSIACAVFVTALINTVIIGNTGGNPTMEFAATDCSGPSTNFNNNAFSGGTGTNEDLLNPPVGPACTQGQLFVDPANNDFHPRKGGARPCTLVDQGTPNGAPTHDLEGTPRPQPAGGNFDIGCYEAK